MLKTSQIVPLLSVNLTFRFQYRTRRSNLTLNLLTLLMRILLYFARTTQRVLLIKISKLQSLKELTALHGLHQIILKEKYLT